MRHIRYGYAETPQGQVHYRERGEGQPVVLLHQTASSGVMWERAMRLWPEGRHLIAMDTPGFGGSFKPSEQPGDMAWYAARAADFLDALDLERPHVIGHHTG